MSNGAAPSPILRPSALNAEVARASAILGADPARARASAEAILRIAPRDPRALLILGSAHRRLGDPIAALRVLEPLRHAYPRAALTAYELGASLAAAGRTDAAIAALRGAVALKADLAEAWRALGDLLFARGDQAGADAAFARHDRAMIQGPDLQGAADAVFEGRLADAENLLRTRLLGRPRDAEALRLMADVFLRQGRFADAETLLSSALEIEPQHSGARFALADALFRQQKAAPAIAHLEALLAREPDDLAYLNLMAAVLGLIGETGRSAEAYEALARRAPAQAKIWLNLGHALRAVGRRDETIAAYRRCIALAPAVGEPYWSLANLKTAAFAPEEEAAMAALLARGDLAAEDRLHLNYALGKALEDRGAYAEAFEHYAAGAALRSSIYDPDILTRLVARSKALFTREAMEARAEGGSPSAAPIFIVGLPRSGSTLIEQILASHSQVEGTMELPEIRFIAEDLTPYPDACLALSPEARTKLGEAYDERTRIYRKTDRPRFVDKMPNNFQHLGLIHLILPRAKIVDARRHPMGSCFSAYKQHFAQGQDFSYDLTALGRYYRDYVDLMAHFDAVLPGRVHRVIYEDMVEDTEGEVRRLLDYCGLEFEPGCLEFHRNARAVRTVSSEQVRRPIFRDGLEQWRNFEPWLDPLKTALGPALEAWR
jgi:tetratricopeptide (TPR) repeat protein